MILSPNPFRLQRAIILRISYLLLFAGTALFPSPSSALPKQESPFILAVQPYLPAFELKKRYQPLAEYLSAALQHRVIVKVSSDYDEHIRDVGTDLATFSFIGPAPYVRMVKAHGKKPILARLETNGKPELRGNIVVRKESGIKSLRELKGARVAFVSRESTMGFLIPRQMLLAEQVSLEDLLGYDFLGSHQNVAMAVRLGDFDAGTVQQAVFLAMQDSLRSLAESPLISEHLFVASGKLAPAVIEKARAALLAVMQDKKGLEILHSITAETSNLVAACDEDYDSLRNILAVPETRAAR
jgi:phosphonate transport system substrate-binding protein